jgi:hypothetical protein
MRQTPSTSSNLSATGQSTYQENPASNLAREQPELLGANDSSTSPLDPQNSQLASQLTIYPQQNSQLASQLTTYPQQNSQLASQLTTYPQQNSQLASQLTIHAQPIGYPFPIGFNGQGPSALFTSPHHGSLSYANIMEQGSSQQDHPTQALKRRRRNNPSLCNENATPEEVEDFYLRIHNSTGIPINNLKDHLFLKTEKSPITHPVNFFNNEVADDLINLIKKGINGKKFTLPNLFSALNPSLTYGPEVLKFLNDRHIIQIMHHELGFDNENICKLINGSHGNLDNLKTLIINPNFQKNFKKLHDLGFDSRQLTGILRKSLSGLTDNLRVLTSDQTIQKLEKLTKSPKQGGLGISTEILCRKGHLDESGAAFSRKLNTIYKIYTDFFERNQANIPDGFKNYTIALVEKYINENYKEVSKIITDDTPVNHIKIDNDLDSLFKNFSKDPEKYIADHKLKISKKRKRGEGEGECATASSSAISTGVLRPIAIPGAYTFQTTLPCQPEGYDGVSRGGSSAKTMANSSRAISQNGDAQSAEQPALQPLTSRSASTLTANGQGDNTSPSSSPRQVNQDNFEHHVFERPPSSPNP